MLMKLTLDDESKIKNGDVLSCPVCRGELPDVERFVSHLLSPNFFDLVLTFILLISGVSILRLIN